jgi:deoxyribonuclease-4
VILGAHESVAGGVATVYARAAADGCEAIQIFSKSSNQWAAKPLAREEIRRFREGWHVAGRPPLLIHDSYLINLASPDDTLYAKSLEALAEELRRADLLGVPFLVMHPGSPLDRNEVFGLERIAAALNEVLRRLPRLRCAVLLENTAGQGAHLGWRFEHLRAIRDAVQDRARIGVCFDTQHAFAAGYDLRTRAAYERTMRELDRVLGIEQVRAFHLNDSKTPLGSRADRHEHIGKGAIGLAAFRLLVNDERFARLPGCLETPGRFRENLDLLKKLRRQSPEVATRRAPRPKASPHRSGRGSGQGLSA